MIKRLLDAGADGLIVPMVNTLAETENLVKWLKYPPLGARNFGVSRAHVKQVLRGAQEQGLLRIDDGNGIRLMPAYFDAAYQLFAAMFALELHTGLRALEAANGG